jgi:hypothetical protein
MNALDTVLPHVSVLLTKLVTTDAASAMLGGKVVLSDSSKANQNNSEFLPIHNIVYCERLIAIYFKHDDVTKTILKTVYFVRSNVKTHRPLKNSSDRVLCFVPSCEANINQQCLK